MIKFKIDVLQALADKGFTRYQIRKHGVIAQGAVQGFLDYERLQNMSPEEIAADPRLSKMERPHMPTLETINTICIILGLKIEDVIEIVPTDEEILKKYHLEEAIKDKEPKGRRKY